MIRTKNKNNEHRQPTIKGMKYREQDFFFYSALQSSKHESPYNLPSPTEGPYPADLQRCPLACRVLAR